MMTTGQEREPGLVAGPVEDDVQLRLECLKLSLASARSGPDGVAADSGWDVIAAAAAFADFSVSGDSSDISSRFACLEIAADGGFRNLADALATADRYARFVTQGVVDA